MAILVSNSPGIEQLALVAAVGKPMLAALRPGGWNMISHSFGLNAPMMDVDHLSREKTKPANVNERGEVSALEERNGWKQKLHPL